MPHRLASPARSENELDISTALLANSDGSASDENDSPFKSKPAQSKNTISTTPGTDSGSDDDDEDFIAAAQAASNRKASNIKGRTVKRGGGFQAMGLSATLLKAIARKGFSVPTPIQRKTIPLLLAGNDVVGMARTGAGKTASFVIPLIEKLKQHSAKVGARALLLSPSRELALQTLRVVKELGRGTDLRGILLVGGDSVEEQFEMMFTNPDYIVATPGRFLHLQVEMGLDLSSISYVVFDEADRLFEMGFAVQLNEILRSLPQARQTLLFSATLPKSLVEFAKAGLQEPKLIRLDSESKISPDLQSAFFTLKSADKEGALLHIIQDIIRIPTGPTKAAKEAKSDSSKAGKKRKRGENDPRPNETPTEHSTVIFTATKHHVDFLASLLKLAGYAVSYVYGSLDQTARRQQVEDFRLGMTHVLVVTDVAARGIDLPALANVINFDFPPQPKIFLHRVGRTARAGRQGWSYSLIRESDCPYLLDLQLFLARPLVLGRGKGETANYSEDVVVGALPRDRVSAGSEWLTKIMDENEDLAALRSVAAKGEKLYQRTRSSASIESARRAKQISASKEWSELHPLFKDDTDHAEVEREAMLARISGFRPQETVFEVGKRGGQGDAAAVAQKRRETLQARKRNKDEASKAEGLARHEDAEEAQDYRTTSANADSDTENADDDLQDAASFSDLEVTFTNTSKDKPSKPSSATNDPTTPLQDPENYMSYHPQTSNPTEDAAYSVHGKPLPSTNDPSSSSAFLTAARAATMDLQADETAAFGEPPRPSMRWDKRHKKYVSTAGSELLDGNKKVRKAASTADGGERGKKWIKSESGGRIAASFKSGRFEAWKKANRIERLPRVGERENLGIGRLLRTKAGGEGGGGNGAGTGTETGNRGSGVGGSKRYRHRQDKAPKEADRYRDDYKVRKKRVQEAREKRMGRFREGEGKKVIKGLHEVKRERAHKQKRREKTGRHKSKHLRK